MLRLKPFEVAFPEDVRHAATLLAQHEGRARLLAGGTDLLPNLKHGIYGEVRLLVSLQRLNGLTGVEKKGGALRIGAGEKLARLAQNKLVQQAYPALALAAGQVASPQIRNMATLGGNLCLDTRCTFINQSAFWRGALGGCLKAEGHECHVVPGGRNCVAAFSGDLAIALLALGAEIEITGPGGMQTRPLAELYASNGAQHLNLAPGEILTRIHIPVLRRRRLAYRKWSVRKSIDFPLVNFALAVDVDQAGKIEKITGVVGVLAARPKILRRIGTMHIGKPLNERLAEEIGDQVYRACQPLPNVPYDPAYRKEMLRIQAKRAVQCLLPGNTSSVRE